MADDEMSPEAWRLLERAGQSELPTKADMLRVRKALAAGLAASVAAAPAGVALAATSKNVVAAATGKAAAAVTGKGVAMVALALLASAGAATVWWTHGGSQDHVAPSVQRTSEVAPAPASVPAPPDSTFDELTLLRRAQRALSENQPRQALELAQRHASDYPASQMALERDALRVFAYCKMKRTNEARALALDILRRAPRSPVRASLEESCAMR